jgi:hypothetical protein
LVAQCVDGELGSRLGTGLAHGSCDMSLDGADGDAQAVGDRLIAEAIHNEADDVEFASSEGFVPTGHEPS